MHNVLIWYIYRCYLYKQLQVKHSYSFIIMHLSNYLPGINFQKKNEPKIICVCNVNAYCRIAL